MKVKVRHPQHGQTATERGRESFRLMPVKPIANVGNGKERRPWPKKSEPLGDDGAWDEIQGDLDGLPIPAQIHCFERLIEEAKGAVFTAGMLVQRISAAYQGGVLREEEMKRFEDLVMVNTRSLQSMLSGNERPGVQ